MICPTGFVPQSILNGATGQYVEICANSDPTALVIDEPLPINLPTYSVKSPNQGTTPHLSLPMVVGIGLGALFLLGMFRKG